MDSKSIDMRQTSGIEKQMGITMISSVFYDKLFKT